MVVVVEVPVIWEVPPQGGLVTVVSSAVRFVSFVGLGLVLQDLQDDTVVGFGGDEYFGEDQGSWWSCGLFAFVFLNSS